MLGRAAISGNVNIIHTRMTSTTDSEIYETSKNMMIGLWYQPLLTFMTLPQLSPTRIYGDNKPNQDMSNGGTIGDSKHIANRVAWQQEHTERSNEFVFDRVSDANNPSDCLGKWVPPKKKRASTSFTFNQRNAIRPLYM